MMDTTLSDELRQQLRLSDLMIAPHDRVNIPTLMSYSSDRKSTRLNSSH